MIIVIVSREIPKDRFWDTLQESLIKMILFGTKSQMLVSGRSKTQNGEINQSLFLWYISPSYILGKKSQIYGEGGWVPP